MNARVGLCRRVLVLLVAALVTFGLVPASAGAEAGMARIGVLEFDQQAGEHGADLTLMAPDGDFAYVVTSTSPLRVLKVDLASFQVVDRLTLAEGENGVAAGVVDSDGRYAYVATRTQPPKVVKVDLDAFTRVDAIAFEGYFTWFDAAAVIDPAGGHAYFAGRDRRLMRVDLDDFSWDPDDDVLELSVGGASGPRAGLIEPDGSHAYFPTRQGIAEPVVVKVDLGAFEEVGTLALPAAPGLTPNDHVLSSAIAPDGSYAYFSHYNSPARISKVDLDAFALVDALELEGFESRPAVTLVSPDGAHAYLGVGPFSTANAVVKVDLDAFERLGVLRMPNNTERNFMSGAITPDGSRAYFGASTNPGRLVAIGLDDAPGDPPERLFGGDRYETAAEIALTRFDAPEVVYLATGVNYPDALAGAPLAAREQAPILLTRPDSLPSDTAHALGLLRPDRVVALGGTSALSDATLATAAQRAGGADTDRLSGPDRYATATAIAEQFPQTDAVFLTTGSNFPDALAGGAVTDGAPILLTSPHRLPEPTAEALASRRPERIIALGGTAALSDAVLAEAAQQAGGAASERNSGPDRYATATAAAELLGEPDTVYVATGVNFPDALTGGPAAVSDGAPILLTRRDDVPGATLDYLDGLAALRRVVILGGTAAVSDEVAAELDAMATGD